MYFQVEVWARSPFKFNTIFNQQYCVLKYFPTDSLIVRGWLVAPLGETSAPPC
jgi:hypothetical protein